MSADIPEDIMQAASAVFQTEIKAGQSGGVFVLERIARAILAERERCARIADAMGESAGDTCGSRDIDFVLQCAAQEEIATRIADEIRAPAGE